jgi:hypothetical protein
MGVSGEGLEVEFCADLRFGGRKVVIDEGKCLIHVPQEAEEEK